jgi:hypothetical protein
MALLFSVSGFGAWMTVFIHGLSVMLCLILLRVAVKRTGRKRIIFVMLVIVVLALYLNWNSTKDNWKNEVGLRYVGKYELTKYTNCVDCILELNKDNSYEIYDSLKTYESSTWKYFDDGDVFYIELGYRGQLGFNEYEYKQNVCTTPAIK